MVHQFTEQARRVLADAEEAARGLNHQYVGTEHILLGLMQDDSGLVARTLRALGTDAKHIRSEIERLVQAGPQPVSQRKLPLTPRSKLAIAFAEEESWMMHQDRIGPEHLIVGLMREPDGVAGMVLQNLGLSLPAVGKRVFEARLKQLEFVERIVRPVSASMPRKRKMRDELLAHVTTIYDEEHARLHDSDTALRAAIERFGEPRELTRELQDALPLHERVSYFVEWLIGWRAPESTTRWMARFAVQLYLLLGGLVAAVAVAMIAELGWSESAWIGMRAIAAILLLMPPVIFTLGVLYFQVRDSTFGVFGSRRSRLRAGSTAALMGLVIFIAGIVYIALGHGDLPSTNDLIQLGVAGLATSLLAMFLARTDGPVQIRDAVWALLDIERPQLHGDSTFEPA
jgi:hypothetical protein